MHHHEQNMKIIVDFTLYLWRLKGHNQGYIRTSISEQTLSKSFNKLSLGQKNVQHVRAYITLMIRYLTRFYYRGDAEQCRKYDPPLDKPLKQQIYKNMKQFMSGEKKKKKEIHSSDHYLK